MAEIQEKSGNDGKKGAQKKMHIRVDFTPMVDMNMLLITFFMLCTTMIKSQTLTIALPTNEKVENQENMSQASEKDAITIIVDAKRKAGTNQVDTVNGKVVAEVYYFDGKPGEVNGQSMLGDGNTIISANNPLKMSEILSDEVNDAGVHSARGIREIIQKRNQDVLKEVNALKQKYKDGGFGPLETKAEREEAMAKFQEATDQVRKNEDLKKPVVIIKSTPEASFGSLIELLDEMQINSIYRYQIDNMTSIDSVMLDDYKKHHVNN